jgi:hypothetical protein
MRTIAVIVSMALLAAGCSQSQTVSAQAQVQDLPPPAPIPSPQPIAPMPPPALADLGLYQFMVPVGAISHSDAFWDKIDQTVLDEDTFHVLEENGLRVGQGNVEDWPYFKKILDHAGAISTHSHFITPTAADQDITVSGEMPEQTLFVYDRHGLGGMVYDQCQNLFELTYEPSSAFPHAMTIQLCPVVRATRRHYHYTARNEADVIKYSSDEHLYDLNLQTDLPEGKFLIVAPSSQSLRPMTIGHQFLTRDAKAARWERILVFVANSSPQAVQTVTH